MKEEEEDEKTVYIKLFCGLRLSKPFTFIHRTPVVLCPLGSGAAVFAFHQYCIASEVLDGPEPRSTSLPGTDGPQTIHPEKNEWGGGRTRGRHRARPANSQFAEPEFAHEEATSTSGEGRRIDRSCHTACIGHTPERQTAPRSARAERHRGKCVPGWVDDVVLMIRSVAGPRSDWRRGRIGNGRRRR